MNIPVTTQPYTNGKLGKSILVVYDEKESGVPLSGNEFYLDISQIMQGVGMKAIQSVECIANTTGGAGFFISDMDIKMGRYFKNLVQTILPMQSHGRMKITLHGGGTVSNITFAVNDFSVAPILVPIS